MGWIVFFIAVVLTFIMTNPFKRFGQLWYAGIISMGALYAIDTTLQRLGAFSFQHSPHLVGELPTPYWLSSFFGGIVLVKYYPKKSFWKLPYILIAAFVFLILELIMHYLGYFNYHNWSLINSFFLDVSGFIVVIWLWKWICEIRNKEAI